MGTRESQVMRLLIRLHGCSFVSLHPSHDDEDNEDLDCTETATIAGMGRRAVL